MPHIARPNLAHVCVGRYPKGAARGEGVDLPGTPSRTGAISGVRTDSRSGSIRRVAGSAQGQSDGWLDKVDLQQKTTEPRWTPARLLLLITAFFAEIFDGPGSTASSHWAVYAVRTDGRYVLAGRCPDLRAAQAARAELVRLAAEHDEAETLALFCRWLAANP